MKTGKFGFYCMWGLDSRKDTFIRNLLVVLIWSFVMKNEQNVFCWFFLSLVSYDWTDELSPVCRLHSWSHDFKHCTEVLEDWIVKHLSIRIDRETTLRRVTAHRLTRGFLFFSAGWSYLATSFLLTVKSKHHHSRSPCQLEHANFSFGLCEPNDG